jgi:hypothetical protein
VPHPYHTKFNVMNFCLWAEAHASPLLSNFNLSLTL